MSPKGDVPSESLQSNNMNAVVIVANGWNAGWLGCYGNEWLNTPFVDRLASEGIVFDQHFAVQPTPGDWQRSLSTGRFTSPASIENCPSLFLSLRQAGVRTVRLRDCRPFPEAANPDTASSEWDISLTIPRLEDAPPGGPLLGAMEDQLQSLKARERWLLWIETDRLLPPWSVSLDYFDRYVEGISPDEDGANAQPWDEPPLGQVVLSDHDIERLHGTFAAVVTEWDADLGRCFDLFNRFELADSALWALTAGHGLSLGEHNRVGPDDHRLYEEMAHVPLIVRLPGAEQAGRRVAVPTACIDLLPTLVEAARLPDTRHGQSLMALMRGSHAPLRPYLCQKAGPSHAIRTVDWAYLHHEDAAPALFRKPEDRWEMNNALMQHLEWGEHLGQTARDFADAMSKQPFIPPFLKDYDDVK